VGDTARRAFAMAGVGPADVDVAEVYDCYSITVILTLEDAGFCAKGDGGAFVESADFGPGSALPLNTNGGQLCMGQAGLAGGATHLLQAVRQLRGAAGDTQVADCEIAFVNGNGGRLSEQCSLVLERSPR
jgi:acetyl-CoA C-acetyltransferase